MQLKCSIYIACFFTAFFFALPTVVAGYYLDKSVNWQTAIATWMILFFIFVVACIIALVAKKLGHGQVQESNKNWDELITP